MITIASLCLFLVICHQVVELRRIESHDLRDVWPSQLKKQPAYLNDRRHLLKKPADSDNKRTFNLQVQTYEDAYWPPRRRPRFPRPGKRTIYPN